MQRMNIYSRWEDAGGRPKPENGPPEAEGRPRHTARRLLQVFIATLVLAFIVWVPVELWGSSKGGFNGLLPQAQENKAPPANAPRPPVSVRTDGK